MSHSRHWCSGTAVIVALCVMGSIASAPASAQQPTLSSGHVLWADFGHLYAYDLTTKKKKRLFRGTDGDEISAVAARGDVIAVARGVTLVGDIASSTVALFDPRTRVQTPLLDITTSRKLDCGSTRGDLAVSSVGELVVEIATRERRECGDEGDHDFLSTTIRAVDGSLTQVPLGDGPARGYLEGRFGDEFGSSFDLEYEVGQLVRNVERGVGVSDVKTGATSYFRNGGRYVDHRALSDDGVLLTVDTTRDVIATTRSVVTSGVDIPVRKTPRAIYIGRFEFCGNRLIAAGERRSGYELIELANGRWRRVALLRQARNFVCDQDHLVTFDWKRPGLGAPTDFRQLSFR